MLDDIMSGKPSGLDDLISATSYDVTVENIFFRVYRSAAFNTTALWNATSDTQACLECSIRYVSSIFFICQ